MLYFHDQYTSNRYTLVLNTSSRNLQHNSLRVPFILMYRPSYLEVNRFDNRSLLSSKSCLQIPGVPRVAKKEKKKKGTHTAQEEDSFGRFWIVVKSTLYR